MSAKKWFEEWFDTPYYHILYQERDEAEARKFIDRLLARLCPPPGARMLDLACGRGRYARYLAELGFDVTGLDLSVNNIIYARQFERGNLHFYTHDMRQPFRTNYYDYIFNIFTSFGYFEFDRDHLKTLRNVRAALPTSGRFVLDYFNSRQVATNLRESEEKTLDDIRFLIRRRIADGRVLKDIQFIDQSRSFRFIESVRLYEREDFVRLFNQAGLSVVNTFGDYQLRPFDPERSPRLILIAKKDDGTTAT